MEALGKHEIFEAAIEIMLAQDRCVTVHFKDDGISVQFPTTRRLAEHLEVPHYYVLPYFAEMERDGLIRRVERVGISTTPIGTRLLLELMAASYPAEAKAVMGEAIFADITGAAGPKETPSET